MLKMQLEVAGEMQLSRALDVACGDLLDFSPVFKKIGKKFQEYETKMFDSEGSTSGKKWKALSPIYAAQKAKDYPGTKILERTGALKRSLTGKDAIIQADKIMGVYGTIMPYALYHQKGSGHLPMRKPVLLSEPEKTAWLKELQKFVQSTLKKANLK